MNENRDNCIFAVVAAQVTFIVCKLTGILNWHWAFVCSPAITAALIVVFSLFHYKKEIK